MKKSDQRLPGVERLAGLITELNQKPISEHAARAARLCLLDTLGVGIYGSTQPEAEMLIRVAKRLGKGEATVWGRGDRVEASMAAMVNGSLCHLRELDDVHYAILHTGCVCVPAAMAVAQIRETSLGQLLRAIINGVEVMGRISLGMDYLNHRERGWHGTATCGAFGGAAAAAYLLGLSQAELADALGTAGSRTGGTWAFSADGAITKRLHPGLAARDGVLAACLAKEGVAGPHYVLEAEDGGFYRLFSREWDMERAVAASSRLEVENVEFKWFASCKSVHSPITAALQIHKENPERKPEDVARVTVEVNRSALSMAGHQYKEDSVVSAQISIPYGVAVGLLGRPGQAEDYSLERLKDAEIRTLSSRVHVVESEEFNRIRQTRHLSGARVTVEWRDGTKSAATITRPKGSMANPMTEEDVVDKFTSLAFPALGSGRAQRLLQLVMEGGEDTPITQLTALLIPGQQ